MKTKFATFAAPTTATLALIGAFLAVPGGASGAPTGKAPCAGVKNCHRVVTIDVDGDRRADRVSWRQISDKQVQIRVRTAKGRFLQRKVNVRNWWKGGKWGGAAWIDGRPGAELLIGSQMGAHTPFYTMLTVRKGRLVVEKCPAFGPYGSIRWGVDSSLMSYAGWRRNVSPNGVITMTQRIATRNGDGVAFKGYNVRYAWSHGRWTKIKRIPRWYKNTRQARKVGGWHVWHLKRFPGI
ncbi:hypothetical protein MU582_16535 [Nocardioidaceae bacterium SCSIO 66511]|nr:hypothetical protein MU582_16535 [Nocardioidaceae bacterium SCSIO 66511]